MATAYAALSANGKYCPYYAVQRITGPTGDMIYKYDPKKACHQAVDPRIAHQVTDMLKGVIQYGTGARFGQLGRPEAGKTGTNENFQDAWFCGYVPQEATAVWVGYPGNPRPMLGVEGFSEMFGGDIPTEIWHDVMAVITKGRRPAPWTAPLRPRHPSARSSARAPEVAPSCRWAA
jgi:penicillin-binding protein 1A